MKDLLLLVAVLGVIGISSAMRAFPIESQEMAERLFQRINPRIVWDESNYLVDVSGRYAHCKYLHQDGTFQVDAKFEKDGQRLGGLRDTYAGEEAHWGAVVTYLENALQSWITDSPYRQQIERAEVFGCSVQPGCREQRGRQVSIACVFSPAYDGQAEQQVEPNAYAFTPEQYILTERIVGISWDRTFFLENLSGTKTECSMIFRNGDTFYVDYETENGITIEIPGIFGSSPNLGDTEDAMVRVLEGWSKGVGQKLQGISRLSVGCSLMPDCVYGGQMYVVVACLYSTEEL